MIQRIQSLLLLGVALCMGAAVGFDVWTKSSTTQEATVSAFVLRHQTVEALGSPQIVTEKNVWYIAALYIVSAILAIATIFLYKNRKQQMMVCAVNSLLMTAALAAALFTTKEAELLFEPQRLGNYGMAVYIPLVAMLLNLVARRFIRRDEELVRSADRLR